MFTILLQLNNYKCIIIRIFKMGYEYSLNFIHLMISSLPWTVVSRLTKMTNVFIQY